MDIYDKMFEELAARDTGDILRYTGSELLDDKKIKLSFFEKEIMVDPEKREIRYLKEGTSDREKSLNKYSSSLVLHYLLNADGSPLTGSWISFRELPGGLFYWQTVPGVLKPLIEKYESDGNGFVKRASGIGGEKYNQFKFASVIHPFKMFPVLIIFDQKSMEFEASARVLFDGSASHYLKTDVIKLIIVYMVKKLCG